MVPHNRFLGWAAKHGADSLLEQAKMTRLAGIR